MAYLEGQYVSGGEGKPWLYDIYDFKKIQNEMRKRNFVQEILEIVKKGFEEDWDLKKIESELGQANFFKELRDIRGLFRSSKIKKKARDENN